MANRLLSLLIVSVGLNLILAVYLVKQANFQLFPTSKVESTQQATKNSSSPKVNISTDEVMREVNPDEGYQIEATYGDLGPQMIKSGVIDEDKFRAVFEKSGQGLSAEEEQILTKGSTKKIKITRENSYFLLNFFWAVGLANKSQVLTAGEITKYGGQNEVGNFASTGGWTLSNTEAMDYYAKSNLISLTAGEEGLVEAVAGQIYRPCCNNSTAFPDCNHGMALLGILELMAANGTSQDEMFQAAKYINAFWFPNTYYDLAVYFKNKEGKSFKHVEPRVILGKDYSSASGWQTSKKWLVDQGIVQKAPKQGGGCGV